ncbi:hypothetical protein ACM25N_16330 [Roseovarius sp. C7]|uniref:hypothetical protein n=1 Tax=Roseovarius sp. C7 TaxID=3398643 RepID=UPI0039F710FE
MSGIALRFMLTGIGFLLFGMLLGVHMGISEDHSLSPVHAHLNLVGGLMFMIFALFYHTVPESALGIYCRAHYWLSLAGVVTLAPGIAMTLVGGGPGLAILGSLLTLASVGFFAVVLLRHRG